MIPTPDMKPEITEYGVYPTNRPIRSTPSAIWISPGHHRDRERLGQALRRALSR